MKKIFSQNWFIYCAGFLVWTLASCNGSADKSNSISQTKPTQLNDSNLVWVDYHWGELPPDGHYDALDSIITKWDLNYQRVQGGCEASEVSRERRKFEKNNPHYFKVLKEKYGKDWRERFDKEVEELEEILEKDSTIKVQKTYDDY